MSGMWPLVGRDDQRERLVAAVRAGRGALVAGEPGVGKTRLVADVAATAAADGFRLVRVVGTRAAATMPFGAFAALVEPGVARVDAAARLHHTVLALAPVCLVVDDAHLLDPASAAVVHRLMLDRVSVLATVRAAPDGRLEPAPDAVTRLAREDGGILVTLPPLTPADVGELLERVLGGHVDGRAAHQLATRSGGNPLLLQELVAAARATGALRERDGIWLLRGSLPVDARLAELLPARLDRLPPAVARLTELLSLADSLDAAALEAAGAGGAVVVAEAERLVTVNPETYLVRLAHPLYADVVAASLPPGRRAARLAELAAAFAGRADEVSRVWAMVWRLDAGGATAASVDASELLDVCRVARALGTSVAERFARAALARGGGVAATIELADLLTHDQRADEAETLLAAIDLDGLDPVARIAVIANRAMALTLAEQRPLDALAVLDAAADPGGRGEPPPLAAMRALALMRGGFMRASADLSESLATDERMSPVLRVAGALTCTAAMAYGGRTDRALEIAASVDEFLPAAATAMPEAATSLRLLVGFCHRLSGDLGAERAIASAGYADALARDHDADRQQYAFVLGILDTLAGRPRAGIRRLREAYAGEGLWWRANLHWVAAYLAVAHAIAGEPAEARAVLDAVRGRPYAPMFDAELHLAAAEIEAAEGAVSRAVERASEAASVARERGQHRTELAALYARVRYGDAAAPAALLAVAAGVDGPAARAFEAHARALAGRDGAALAAAAAGLDAIGHTWYAAEAHAQSVRAYRVAGRHGTAALAAERLRSALDACEPLSTPALAGGGDLLVLTRRESEIALLAAARHADRVIAERLGLSVRTVQTHLARAYAKLGVTSREQLRSRLLTHE